MIHTTWLQNYSKADDAPTLIKDMVDEGGQTCVSIVIPTHRLGQNWKSDRLQIHKAIISADVALQKRSVIFSREIDSLFQQIDFKKNREGIGIFVSPHIKKLVSFPFPVTQKVIVNKFFHLHDLIYIENYRRTFYLLDLSKKEVHLFKGMMDHLEEISDENFPKKLKDNYEYNKPSRSNSGTGYAHEKEVEKDKSILNQVRLKSLFKGIDKIISQYLTTQDTPLILCGPTKDTAAYRSVTKHTPNIITSMSDNYKGTSIHDLAVLAWLQIRTFIDEQKMKLVNEFKEKLGERLGVYDLEQVWSAAKAGRGLMLLVEKDYAKSAYITTDNMLFLQDPRDKGVRYYNVVEEIISTVLSKNGEVIVLEKDALKNYGGIALMLRY